MTSLESYVIAVQQKPVRVWRGGAGAPLLLLHAGGGDAHAGWHRIWDDLSRDFTVVAPDWPGFGESEAMRIPQISLASLAAWIEDLRQALGFEKWSIVGNSFGATTGRLYAAEFPAHVERLVLISGGRLPTAAEIAPTLTQIFLSARITGPDDLAREMLKMMFHDPNLLTPELVEQLTAGTTTTMAILGQLSVGTAPEHTIPQAPTLVLWGDDDRYVPPATGQALAAKFPKAKFKLIPEAGHMPQIECPGAVVAALREFLLE